MSIQTAAGRLPAMVILDADLINREWTRFYDKGFDWILSVGPRMLLAALLLFGGLRLIRVLRKNLAARMGRKNVHSSLRPFIESLVFTLLHVALAFLILQIIGVKLTMFAAVVAAFGAAAGLALSGTLQNFASGVLILLLKPFQTGDNIVAQGLEGTVTSIQIFYTVITTFDNRTVIMPNSKLSNEVIINITHEGIRRLDVELKFKNDREVRVIKELLTKAFLAYPEVLDTPPPRIGVTAIEPDGYTIKCNVWVNAHGFEDSRMIVNEKIIATLAELYKADSELPDSL